MRRVLALGLVLVVAGCTLEAGSQDEVEPVCAAGKVSACPCADGTNGTQTCKSDGAAWGSCQCSMPAPVASDPAVACSGEQTRLGAEIEPCPASWPRMYVTCQKEIVDAGVCHAFNALYCCPAK